MSIENSQAIEQKDILELPVEFTHKAITTLEESLNEGYREPETNLDKLKEFLYKNETYPVFSAEELINAYPYLYHVIAQGDFLYPPGDTPVEVLKSLLFRTVNPFMEKRCWELLKRHDELAKFQGNHSVAMREIDYEGFVQKYQISFEEEPTIIPANKFSRLLSSTIIDFIDPKDEKLVELFSKYTENGRLLHDDTVYNLQDENQRLKALAICSSNNLLKEYLEQSQEEIILNRIPRSFYSFKNPRRIVMTARKLQKQYQEYLEECAGEALGISNQLH